MASLLDRSAELQALRERLEQDTSLSLVYGPRRAGKTQIDLMARYGDQLLLLECKWRANRAVPVQALVQLRDQASRFPLPRGVRRIRHGLASAGRLPRPTKTDPDSSLRIGLSDLQP